MKKVFAHIAALWHMLLGNTDKIIVDKLDEAVRIAGAVKRILDSKGVEILSAIIPGDADDALIRLIKDRLDRALQAVTPALDEIKDMTPEARIEYLIQWLRNLYGDKEIPGGLIRDIAARYLQQATAKKLPLEDHVANAIVEQKVFTELYTKKSDAGA